MRNHHQYTLHLKWLGNHKSKSHGEDRLYEIHIDGKPNFRGSADRPFFGDNTLYNPEDMMLSALSSCHMMSFLYVCRKSGIVLKSYSDNPIGNLKLNADGSGQFEQVSLKPKVVFVEKLEAERLRQLHEQAGKLCFIANSVNFPILIEED